MHLTLFADVVRIPILSVESLREEALSQRDLEPETYIMAIATFTSTSHAGASRSSSKGFMHRAFSSLVTARERQARRYVNGYLLSLDDATLAAYGYDRAELERQGSATSAF